MREILFLAHRLPFPPDRGDKIRSHHLLKQLARIAPVHVATFADDEADMAHEAELAGWAQSYCLVRRSKPLVMAGVQALASGAPVSLSAFHHRALEKYVARLVETRPIGAIYVFSGQMGQYVPRHFAGRVIADFVDVDSAKFEAYASHGEGLRGWIDAREARVLRSEEARLADRANVSLLISRQEAELFRSRLPEAIRKSAAVRVLPNGIDAGNFDPAAVIAEPRMLEMPSPRLIFTGQMDYAPNIAAAQRAIERILPAIRQRFPAASFHVVGRNPPEALLKRHGSDGCFVWGGVPDMRQWLKAGSIALVPLDIARGVQNKVLEAMAMELPVVLTPGAATGIDAADGSELLVRATDEDLAEAVAMLAADPVLSARIGQAARAFVCDKMSWQSALSSLPQIVGLRARPESHVA